MSIEAMKQALEALIEARRYVVGAYECAFPDRDLNESVIRQIDETVTAIQQAESEPVLPDGYVVAPHFRGYARLGIGAYLINHSAPGHEPELVISVATEDEKAGRSVGEDQDNAPGSEIQPEQIAVRLCFENVAGLDALEKQLRYLREVHFSGTHPAPGVPTVPAAALDRLMALLETQAAQIIELEDSRDAEPGVPDGYVLVPIAPTVEMMRAWNSATGDAAYLTFTERGYDAMLTAAQAQKGGE